MEFLKKTREPWEIGIDPILAAPGMREVFYYSQFGNSTRADRQIQSSRALQSLCLTTSIKIDDESISIVSEAASLRNEFAGKMGAKPKKVTAYLSHI